MRRRDFLNRLREQRCGKLVVLTCSDDEDRLGPLDSSLGDSSMFLGARSTVGSHSWLSSFLFSHGSDGVLESREESSVPFGTALAAQLRRFMARKSSITAADASGSGAGVSGTTDITSSVLDNNQNHLAHQHPHHQQAHMQQQQLNRIVQQALVALKPWQASTTTSLLTASSRDEKPRQNDEKGGLSSSSYTRTSLLRLLPEFIDGLRSHRTTTHTPHILVEPIRPHVDTAAVASTIRKHAKLTRLTIYRECGCAVATLDSADDAATVVGALDKRTDEGVAHLLPTANGKPQDPRLRVSFLTSAVHGDVDDAAAADMAAMEEDERVRRRGAARRLVEQACPELAHEGLANVRALGAVADHVRAGRENGPAFTPHIGDLASQAASAGVLFGDADACARFALACRTRTLVSFFTTLDHLLTERLKDDSDYFTSPQGPRGARAFIKNQM